MAKFLLQDYAGAAEDFKKSIGIDPTGSAYYFLGLSKISLGDMDAGDADIKTSKKMGYRVEIYRGGKKKKYSGKITRRTIEK